MLIKTLWRTKPLVGAHPNPTHPLARNLVGCWLLNEGAGRVAHDVSGYRLDGGFSGGPSWSPGPFGQAVVFDGSDDWINMGDCLDLRMDDVSMFAIVRYSAIAQPDEWGGLHYGAIAGKGHLDGTGRGYGLSVDGSNRIEWQVRDQAAGCSVVSDGTLNDGQYHLAVGTCDRDDSMGMRLYIDGIPQLAIADPTVINGYDINGSRAFAIGSRQDEGAGSWFWDFAGSVAAVYVWKRVLTEVEIRRLQVAPFALFAREPVVALLGTPAGSIVQCAGSAGAQAAASAALRVTRGLAASAHGVASASAALQVVRAVSGTISGVSALHAVGATSISPAGDEVGREVERSWRREALFNGMTGAAFKLGTTLAQGWFWVRRRGCTALYRGESIAQVDFDCIIHAADANANKISLLAHLSHIPGSTCCYAIRRFNSCGYQEKTAVVVAVHIAPDGQLAAPSPNTAMDLKAEPIDGNKLRLVWFYCPLNHKAKPDRFNVYWDAGSGHIDLGNTLAAILYRGRKFYYCDTGVLEDGQYRFVVKTEGAAHIESMLATGVTCQVRSLPSEPPAILTAQAI